MKKYRVYLSPTSPIEPKGQYRVTKTVNTLTVSIGQLLTEKEVSELMRRPGFEVTIQLVTIQLGR